MNSSSNKKGTSVISWLGLGISIFVFLLILLINLLLFNSQETFDFKASIYMILFLAGGLLGLLGFIFSLAGLIMAIKNYSPKWIGVCGIVISCLSLVSYFAIPIFATTSIVKEPTEVIVPSSILDEEDNSNAARIEINENGTITCSIEENETIHSQLSVNLNDAHSKDQFTSWVNENLDDNTPITIAASSNTDYSFVDPVMDWLHDCGHSRFTLKTDEDIH